MTTQPLPVPGGTVTLRTMRELNPRQKRRIKPYVLALSGKLEKIGNAATVVVDGKLADSSSVLDGADVSLSLAEADLFVDMQDQTTLALLASWSHPHPLPTTLDQLLDVDDLTGCPGLYDAIATEVAKVTADELTGGDGFEFSKANVTNLESPTGA